MPTISNEPAKETKIFKEGLIKSVSEGNKALEHTRSRNGLGILTDRFNLIITSENGFKTIYPFLPPIKVNNFTRHTNFPEGVVDYTEEEMIKFLRNNP